MACCCFLPARDVWQPLTVIQREQSAICHKKDRGFNKFGEERKGILLGRTDQGSLIINLPKPQPNPWTNSVILQGHWPLLHCQYVTIQGMNSALEWPHLSVNYCTYLTFLGCSAHISSPSPTVSSMNYILEQLIKNINSPVQIFFHVPFYKL